jgi:hypothetical protein
MWGQADLQKLVQMLTYLGIGPGGVVWGGGAVRPTSPQQYQLFWDTTLGGPGQLICATQITPTVVWCDAAGVPV